MNPISKLNDVILKSGSFTLINGVIGFILNLLYVRYLGLNLYGQLSLILSVSTLVFSFASLGVSSSITRILSEYMLNSKQITFFILFIFLTASSLVLVFSYPTLIVSEYFFDLTKSDLSYVKIYILINLFLFFPYSIGICIYESKQELSNVLKVNVLINIIKISSFIILINNEINLKNSLLVIFLIPNLTGFIYIYFKLLKEKHLNFNFKSTTYDLYMLKKLYVYSIKSFPLSFSEILVSNMTYIFLNNRYSYSEIGLFRILNTIVKIGKMLPHFISKVLLPVFTKMFVRNLSNTMIKYFMMFTNISFTTFFIGIIPLILFKNEWFSVIKSTIGITNESLILLATILYILSGNFIGSVFGAINKPQISSYSSIFSSVVSSCILFYSNIFNGGVESCLFFLFVTYLLNQFILFSYLIIKQNMKVNYIKFIIELFLILLTFTIYIIIEKFMFSIMISISFKIFFLFGILFFYYCTTKWFNFFDNFIKSQVRLFINSIKIK